MAKIISVRLEDELSKKLERLAVSMDRPKAWLIEQAIKRYVDEQSGQVQAIKEALDDYRSGESKVVPHEEVMAELDKLEAEIQGSLQR
jgi:predicted transcriptional regulator